MRRWILSIACVMFMSATLFAQTTGTIVGQVSDPSGAAVPNAAVRAENIGTGLVRTGTTGALGEYLFPGLPPGDYKVSVEAPGFKVFSQTGVTLQLGQNARVDARLELGTRTETVTVQGQILQVDTAASNLGASMAQLQVMELPLNGRNPIALAEMLPGVANAVIQTAPTMQRTGGPRMNISGGRASGISFLLDGAVVAAAMSNYGLNLPNPDTLEEFRILTHNYSAEYGRGESAVFLAVTKSGTNEVHGTLWEFLRNDALNARNFFAGSQKPILRQNQFGAAVGGPVVLPGYHGKNRTFFFGSYEGLRIRQQTLNTGVVPTAAQRAGDFSDSSAAIIDPVTGQAFSGNKIPASRIDPLAKSMLQFVPLPNQPGGVLQDLRSVPLSGNQISVKVDHQLSGADRLSFRYYRNRYVNSATGGGISDQLTSPQSDNTKSFTAEYTHIFGPHLLNQFRGSYTRWNMIAQPAETPSLQELGALFNSSGRQETVPIVNVTGWYSVSTTNLSNEPDRFRQIDDTLSWIHGGHHISTGFRALNIRHGSISDQYTSGNFTFSGTFTKNAMADYLIGRPATLLQYSTIYDDSSRWEFQPFVQDDFKVNRNLTLNLGLRYDLIFPWRERYGRNSGFRAGYQSTIFPGAPPGLVVQGDPGVPDVMYTVNKNRFAPRVGLAWDPTGNGKTAVRAAFGIFYATFQEQLSARMTNNPPFLRNLSIVPFSFSDPYHGQTSPFPYTYSSNPNFTYPMEVRGDAPNLRLGYVEQFNLTIQHQFLSNLVVTGAYVGSVGHKLLQTRDINTAVYGPGATANNVQQRRPILPQYYAGLGYAYSDGNSNYHSLQVEAQEKWSKGYTFQVAYTYSKSIDDLSVADRTDSTNTLQDPKDYRKGNRGLSSFDQRHTLTVNGLWELPFLRNKGWLHSALGGWELTGTFRLTSGVPINVTSGRDVALIGTSRDTGAQRTNVIGDPNLDPNRPHGELVAAYFNKAAFALPASGQFGNFGRDALIGPGFAQVNLALVKSFALWKDSLGKIQFRAEFFNLLNNVNFDSPNNTFTSPAFGQLQSAKDARIVQLALKWAF